MRSAVKVYTAVNALKLKRNKNHVGWDAAEKSAGICRYGQSGERVTHNTASDIDATSGSGKAHKTLKWFDPCCARGSHIHSESTKKAHEKYKQKTYKQA